MVSKISLAYKKAAGMAHKLESKKAVWWACKWDWMVTPWDEQWDLRSAHRKG